MFIYAYIKDDEVKYVGQTVNLHKRKANQVSNAYNELSKEYNYPLSRAIRKYGIDAFRITIIDTAASREELDRKEIYWIEKHKTYTNKNLYNQTPGGELNTHQEKVSKEIVDDIIQRLQSGESQTSISKSYNLSNSFISNINNGKIRHDNSLTYPLNKMTKGRKITDEMLESIMKDLLGKETMKVIGERYGVTSSAIGKINNGEYKYQDQTIIYPIRKSRNLSQEEVASIEKELLETQDSMLDIRNRFGRSESVLTEINKGNHRHSSIDLEFPIRK